jgi:hypothetical protein
MVNAIASTESNNVSCPDRETAVGKRHLDPNLSVHPALSWVVLQSITAKEDRSFDFLDVTQAANGQVHSRDLFLRAFAIADACRVSMIYLVDRFDPTGKHLPGNPSV